MAWIRHLAFLALFSTIEALVRPDAQQACFQQHCLGCSGEPCLLCKLQYCSAGTPTPVNANGCNCEWITSDDCKKQDACANSCRSLNPWGPCGRGIVDANGCDCKWIPNDDCIKQDQCAVACRAANPPGRCGGSLNLAVAGKASPSVANVEPQKDKSLALQPLNETGVEAQKNESLAPQDGGLDFSTNTKTSLDLVSVKSRLDPAALVCYQQHCFGCSGEQCLYCQQLYCSSPGGGSRTPVNTKDCTCDWIPNDDCIKHDRCAVACRRANAWGRCGSGSGLKLSTNTAQLVAVASSLDPSTLICYQQHCFGCSGEQCLYCQQLYCSSPGGGSRTPVNTKDCTCDWIPNDDCIKHDRCAVACRRANAWGRCGSGSGLELSTNTAQLVAVASNLDSSTLICYQQRCLGCSGEQCLYCQQLYCSGTGNDYRTPVDANGCKCDWIPRDDCQKTDRCARTCRAANPWGRCGGFVDVEPQMNFAAAKVMFTSTCFQEKCGGCSGEQCLDCLQKSCGK